MYQLEWERSDKSWSSTNNM